MEALSAYPATAGGMALRQACSDWLKRRYQVSADPASQVLPVNGSREALFAFAQTVLNGDPDALVVCPNPFYQIYEGAALLAGAQPFFVASRPEHNFAVDWYSVPESVWAKAQLVFVCSPGNPTGAVMPLEEWQKLFALSDQYGFVLASDECYSEIYFGDKPPLGGLEAAMLSGRTDFRNLVSFTSLSKRSNVPGMRSGFVAGDAKLTEAFCATVPTMAAPWAAWCKRPALQRGMTRCMLKKTVGCTEKNSPKSHRCCQRCWMSLCRTRVFTFGLVFLTETMKLLRLNCWFNTMSLCCQVVIWREKSMASTQAKAEFAWLWSHNLRNVLRQHNVSFNLFNPTTHHPHEPTTAIHH